MLSKELEAGKEGTENRSQTNAREKENEKLNRKITERNTNPPNSQCSDGAHTLLGIV